MTLIAGWIEKLISGRMGLNAELAEIIADWICVIVIVLIGLGLNWICQALYRWMSKRHVRLFNFKWRPYLSKRKLGSRLLMLVPVGVLYLLPYVFYKRGDEMIRNLHRADIIFMLVVVIMVANSLMMVFLDVYNVTGKNRNHPLKSLIQALQVILYFVGGIAIVAVLIDRSPAVLLTGLGASAAVLMLIFKDSILGFVAGVQLSQNDMLRLGDWIQMPDGSANGTVEEITLNTVKVRNWDNTLSMIPPYTLVSAVFKNWRGMQEGGGRRVDKCLFIDMNTLEICTRDMTADLCKDVPLLKLPLENQEASGEVSMTNIQLYRMYIETYLRQNIEVNTELDIIITQKEATAYGLPIEVYFFLKDKRWAFYERKQSDIFDHLMAMAPKFALRMYQRP